LWALMLAVSTPLGLLGVAGAWWRLAVPHTSMSHVARTVVRSLLFLGVIASTLLTVLLGIGGDWLWALVLALVVVSGVAFIRGTPVAL